MKPNSNYEMINFGTDSPIRFFIHTIGTITLHWHQGLELLYVSSGTVSVTVKNTTYHLKEDDIILFNPYEIHSLQAEHCVIVSFQIQLNLYDKKVLSQVPLHFDCNSSLEKDKSRFDSLKYLLAMLIRANTETDAHTPILNKSLSYALLHQLISTFGVEEYLEDKDAPQTLSRMENILEYINNHYQEKLSLNQLAEQFYLTVPYLSRTFKKYIGVNFLEYLTNLRLTFAVNDLLETEDSIEKIAEKNGFPNSRSFVSAFRDSFQMLPSTYRRDKTQSQHLLPAKSALDNFNHVVFEQHNYLGRLAEYLEEPAAPQSAGNTNIQKIDIAPISINQKGYPLQHNFKTITSIGKAKQILYSENQNMLRELQQDIGFRYIKFHGLLDDDMMVYSESPEGIVELSFTYIDMAFDFLLSIGLKPLMQLSFMPKALAKTPQRTMFYRESVISLPKDLNKWCYLIEELIFHLETRYGVEEVETWPFCLWNEPDSPTTMFGFDETEEFFAFYKATYETVKRCNPNIAFGSPSMMYATMTGGDWLEHFMDFCATHHCLPNFFNFHFYPISLEVNTDSNLQQHKHLILDRSEDALKDSLYLIRKNIRDQGWDVEHLFMTEWNSSVSHRDLLNDTAFKATYIVKNILENYDRISSFGYWVSTDFIEEVKMVGETYHGGLGLFTYNGIKKAHYYAFTLLARLGSNLIGKGSGYFITKKGNSIQIILYNYQHYSALYASGELFDMTFTNRYTPFLNPKVKKFTIPLTDLQNGPWLITETIVNRKHGSSFDNWIEYGALPLETKEEIDYLKSISVPYITKRKVTIEDNTLPLQVELEPHEIRLLELKPWFR